MIRAIASDMDGTMLRRDGTLSPLTLAVLKECTRRGIPFFPVSGRTRPTLWPLVTQIGAGTPCIGGNGAEIIGPDQAHLCRYYLPAATARRIVCYLENRDVYVQAYSGGCAYYTRAMAREPELLRQNVIPITPVDSLRDFLDFDPPKLLAIAQPERVAELLPEVSAAFAGETDVTRSNPAFLEIVAAGVNKGNALKVLCESQGVNPEDLLAFGDGLNDISMLRFAGNGIAVSNADPAVREAADGICLSNEEDGPARYIAHHVLKLSPEEVLL